MRSTYGSGSGAAGSASLRNTARAARDTTGRGWESVHVFHSYSEAPQSFLQPLQLQHEEQLRPLIFPDVSPSVPPAPTGASPVYTRIRSGSTPPSSSAAATRGASSSRASPWIFSQPSTAAGPLQEQPYREANHRPSPWQGRSPLDPSVVTASPVFPRNRTNLTQPGRSAVVPMSADGYLDRPHALYRAARLPAPAVQSPSFQHLSQIPQQTVVRTPPQFSGKNSPPSQPQFPSKAPSLGPATEGTSAERDTARGPSVARSRLTPRAAGVADSAATGPVFPDASSVDAATLPNNQSSKGAAVSSADVKEGEIGQEGTKAGARAKRELLDKSSTSDLVDDTHLRVTAKQDTPAGTQAGTYLSSETVHTSRSRRDSRSAQGGACQAAVQQPPVFSVTAAEELLSDNTAGGIRQRPVLGAQQTHAPTQQRCTQERPEKQLDEDTVDQVPKVARPTQPAETKRGKPSLRATRARLFHEILRVLQLDASDLIPPDDLPYLGPFDLIPSDLSQGVGISRGLIVNEPDSITFKGMIGVDDAYVEQSRLLSTENRRSTFGDGYVDASGIRWIFKKLYAQAGRHLEQMRSRHLYSPTMAGTSAIYCLTFVLYCFLTVAQSFVRYLRLVWASTSSSMSETRPLLAPHSFAIGVLSLGASACLLLAAVFSFRLFLRHLRISSLSRKISSSNRDVSAPQAASQGKPLFPHHTDFSSTEDVSTATQRIQVSLGAEYERLYTMCARGDIVAGHKHAVEAADAALESLLDSSKQVTAGYELSRQSDREEEERNKIETLHQAQGGRCNTPVAETQVNVESSPALTGNLSPSTLTRRHASSHITSYSTTGSLEQRSGKSYAAFIQNITDKNLVAYTTRLNGVKTCVGGEDEAGLVTATDMWLRNHTLHTMWLTFGCAVTAAVARMVLTLLLSQAVSRGVPSHWAHQHQAGDATALSWNMPENAGEELFFPARTPPPPSNWWERFRTDYRYGGNSVTSSQRIHSVDADGRTLPHLATAAVPPTATSVLTALWIALNRLATFQMQAAGFMAFTQFVAVSLLLQPREELRLTPVMARTTAFVYLGVAVVELLCTGFDALTLLLGELALKGLLLLLVHLAGQRIVQLSRENFAAKITYRSRLAATFFTAAAAGALLASTCSARGAAAVEASLAERRKKLTWGRTSILRQPSEKGRGEQ